MSDAPYIPIFVTADVPIDTINSVLSSPTKETFQNCDKCRPATTTNAGSSSSTEEINQRCENCAELIANIWVLISHPYQSTFPKPTNPPIPTCFESAFLDASITELQDFVATRFGGHLTKSGEGEEGIENIANDAFAIIDERTVRDGTIAFFAQDYVDRVQEAEVRVAWRRATEWDEALVRFTDVVEREREGDVGILLAGIRELQENEAEGDGAAEDESGNEEGSESAERQRARLEQWIAKDSEESRLRWFEFRLKVEIAVQCTFGINQRGASYSLLNREDEFDEDGVMI